jgi:geranylgeranyl pyrophosphate synthase
MAEEDFREYVAKSRPVLDKAFHVGLCDLMDGALTGGSPSLMSALEDGKKIRGCFTCIVGEALGAGGARLIPRAVAVELIQTATLIHDDFIDQDTMRRNRPAVWTTEGARRAVLMGDVIFAGAIRMMSELSREDGLAVARAIALISSGALREPLTLAELTQLVERDCGSGERLYEKIIRLKTGILFGTACELGAIAAGAPAELREAAYRYGLITGDAYQIADDLEDLRALASGKAARMGQIVTLAPALVYFAPSIGHKLVQLLKKGEGDAPGELEEFRAAAQGPMERRIEQLLDSAASEIKDHFPANTLSLLAEEAPRGTIRLFNGG